MQQKMDTREDRQLVLVTTVDIGGGRTDQIELYVGDRPEVWHSISTCTTRPAIFAAWLWKPDRSNACRLRPTNFACTCQNKDAAAAFCTRNGLPESVVQPLTEHIRENYLKAQQEASEVCLLCCPLHCPAPSALVYKRHLSYHKDSS